MFNNLQNDFDFNGKISVSSLLGFNNIENVNYLHRLVLSHYPNLENNDTNALSINEATLGSTIFISTNNYLKLVFSFPCKNCGDHKIINKKWQVRSYGLYLSITIYCYKCKFSSEFCNE